MTPSSPFTQNIKKASPTIGSPFTQGIPEKPATTPTESVSSTTSPFTQGIPVSKVEEEKVPTVPEITAPEPTTSPFTLGIAEAKARTPLPTPPEGQELYVNPMTGEQTFYTPTEGFGAKAMWRGVTPWKEELGETVGSYGIAKGIGIMAAELLVPGVSTARHWDEMGAGGKAFSIGLDALILLPVAGAVGKGARTATVAARGGMAGARAARVATAVKAGTMELERQVLFPVELAKTVGSIAKPIKIGTEAGVETLRGTRAISERAKNIVQSTIGQSKASISSIETILSPAKLPESVVSDAWHTIKIPLDRFDSVEGALKARTQLMEAANKPGNKIIIETDYEIITLKRGPLMRELGGGVAHATPQGEKFITGTVVAWKNGKPLHEQGLFVSHEPLPRFAETAAFGGKGKEPTIRIFSPEFAQKSKITDKLYKNVVEMERVFDVGTVIPAPKQTLFTRLGHDGTRVNISLDKALSTKQILKLKAEGLIEQVKNIYEPAITIVPKKGKGLTRGQALKLADIIETNNRGVARNLRGVSIEPHNMLRILQRLEEPVVYRITDTQVGNRIETEVRKEEPRPGETGREVLDRVNAEGITTERVETQVETPRVEPPRELVVEPYVEPPRIDRGRPPTGHIPPRVEVPRVEVPRIKPRLEIPKEKAIKPIGKVSGKDIEELTTAQLRGAITWRQGQLHGKGVWIVIYPPYQKGNKIYVMGNPPFGVHKVEGIKSAYKSAEIVRGGLKQSIEVSMGAFKVHIPKGKKGKVGKRMVFKIQEPTVSTAK